MDDFCKKSAMAQAKTPESMIAEFSASVERMRNELALAEAELRGMLRIQGMQSLSPIGPPAIGASARAAPLSHYPKNEDGTSEAPRKGRQPGAISATWRLILSDLYWSSGAGTEKFGVAEIIEAAKSHGISLRPSEAQSRMQHYEKFDFTHISEGGVIVTTAAAQKFGFNKEPLKNEASANAEAHNNPSMDESDTYMSQSSGASTSQP
jgi:hypothetical protein